MNGTHELKYLNIRIKLIQTLLENNLVDKKVWKMIKPLKIKYMNYIYQIVFRHRVGASLKPKLVRPGRILVRLRSQMFEADVEAGEDKEMAKEEPDFRGRDFEKQYACR